jgi:hypothetical protein
MMTDLYAVANIKEKESLTQQAFVIVRMEGHLSFLVETLIRKMVSKKCGLD